MGWVWAMGDDKRSGGEPLEVSDVELSRGVAMPGPGTILDKAYRLLRPVGKGAMGVVYLAHDLKLRRDVAIKLIDPKVANDTARALFLREARAMAGVTHENVVRIYALGEHEGVPYFVMEYVPGRTVSRWIADHEPGGTSIDEVIGIMDQVCRGVTAIHAAGIIHGDVKPGNVLLGAAFRAAVCDFGLIRFRSKVNRGGLAGTPAYIAPEHAVAGQLTEAMAPRADVYALSVMTYEMLTGQVPYDVYTAAELLEAHTSDAPIRPASDHRQDLPTAFDEVLAQGLARDPEERLPTPDRLRRALFEAREAVSQQVRQVRVVVADDDEDFRSLAREALRFAMPGAVIECVPDGAAALAAIDREPAELAVIDLDMPVMNGVELTAALRASGRLPGTAIIVVTAIGGAPDWKLLSSLGADGFLVKPIDPYALVAIARRTLQGRLGPDAKKA